MATGGVGIGERLLDLVSKLFGCLQYNHKHLLAGTLLLKNLHEARKMAQQCGKVCNDFERQTDQETVGEWREMKYNWECNPLKPDPYKFAEKGGFYQLCCF